MSGVIEIDVVMSIHTHTDTRVIYINIQHTYIKFMLPLKGASCYINSETDRNDLVSS